MTFGSEKKHRRRKTDYAGWVDDDLLGLVEPGMELEGKMTFNSGMVRLNAHYKGEIHCQGLVVVAEQGELEAEIHAKVVSISGKVKGSVHASERLEIKENGIVLGDVFTPCLTVEPGGYFDGQCHMPTPISEKATAHETESSAY
jgi:cytoskeletal protein CcmA (bactofilin family)